MPLTTSCEALYFPPEPMDNVLTLRWSNSEQFNLGAYSLILYKLKCSAPRLFHVVPRYGAIPLVDGAHNETNEARHGVNVVIGLHGYVLKAREAAWHSSNLPDSTQDPPFDSANGNSPTPRPTTAAPSSSIGFTTASGIPFRLRAQEKFAIEYVLVTDEQLAYEEMTKALANSPAAVTEEAERLWALVMANAFSRTHLLLQSSITLTAYTENVLLTLKHTSAIVTTASNTTETSSNTTTNTNVDISKYIIVPPHAQLTEVPPSRWQQTSISPRSATNKDAEENYRNGNKNTTTHVNSMSRASVQTVHSPLTASERQSMMSNGSHHPPLNTNTNTNKDATISSVFAASPTRRTNEELQALKEEIRSMRSEQTPTPGSGTPYYHNHMSDNSNNSGVLNSSNSNGSRNNDQRNSTRSNNMNPLTSSISLPSQKPSAEASNERQKYESRETTLSRNVERSTPLPHTSASSVASGNSSNNSDTTTKNVVRTNSSLSAKSESKAAKKKEAEKRAAMLLMQIPSTARPPRQGNGVKLYMLLIMMFVAYFFILYQRRPAKEHIGAFAAPRVMSSYKTFHSNYSGSGVGLVQNHKMLNATEIHIPR